MSNYAVLHQQNSDETCSSTLSTDPSTHGGVSHGGRRGSVNNAAAGKSLSATDDSAPLGEFLNNLDDTVYSTNATTTFLNQPLGLPNEDPLSVRYTPSSGRVVANSVASDYRPLAEVEAVAGGGATARRPTKSAFAGFCPCLRHPQVTRHRSAFALVAGLLIAVLLLMAALAIWKNARKGDSQNPLSNTFPATRKIRANDHTICTTASCVRAAANFLQAIDFTVDPCDNFFDYACGLWNKDYPIPDDMAAYGTFANVRDLVRQQLKSLLEDTHMDSKKFHKSMRMAKMFYQACLNTTVINKAGTNPMMPALKELGGWPILNPAWDSSKTDITQLVALLKKSYAIDTFVTLFVYADAKNTNANILTIDKGPLGLGGGTRDYYLNDSIYGSHMEAYQTYIIDVVTILAKDMNVTVDERVLRESRGILRFEKQFAAITTPDDQRRNHSLMYNKWVLDELTAKSPFVDWRRFFGIVMPAKVWQLAKHTNYTVIVAEPDFMTELNELLLRTDKKTIVNYLIWRFVKTWCKVLDKRFDEVFQDFAQVMLGRQQKPVRWKSCVPAAVSSFDMAVGALYVKRHFKHEDKLEAMKMIKHLQDAFQELVLGLDWMDNATKSIAVEKAKAMLNHIGYPEFILNQSALSTYYEDLEDFLPSTTYFSMNQKMSVWSQSKDLNELLKPFDRNKFETSPAIVNAFYSPEKNAITFPAGILQPPFFKGDYPKAINYGAMGAVIGHEITHGFDDQGSQYDKNGNLKDWWTPAAFEGFRQRTQCIIQQYSNYSVPDVQTKVNGRLTQGENIADNGGVKEAYVAYKKYLLELGQDEPRLPGLLNLTNEQIFFLSYANFWCGQKKQAAALQQVLTDPHSPEMYRVIGVLSNLDEFSSAFDCTPGSNMNPFPRVRKKCRVW